MSLKALPLTQSDVRLFSGRSNLPLARSLAASLGIRLEETHFSRFSNDNLFVQLGASVRGRAVFLVQSLVPPVSDHLMELLMMIDIAKGAAARDSCRYPLLFLCPFGQKGRAAHLHHRPPRGRSAPDGRGQPHHDHDPALAPGSRLLRCAHRSFDRSRPVRRLLPAAPV